MHQHSWLIGEIMPEEMAGVRSYRCFWSAGSCIKTNVSCVISGEMWHRNLAGCERSLLWFMKVLEPHSSSGPGGNGAQMMPHDLQTHPIIDTKRPRLTVSGFRTFNILILWLIFLYTSHIVKQIYIILIPHNRQGLVIQSQKQKSMSQCGSRAESPAGKNPIINTGKRIMCCWLHFWNHMTQNIICFSGFMFLFRDDYDKALISVPVNNYFVLVILHQQLIHLRQCFEQLELIHST